MVSAIPARGCLRSVAKFAWVLDRKPIADHESAYCRTANGWSIRNYLRLRRSLPGARSCGPPHQGLRSENGSSISSALPLPSGRLVRCQALQYSALRGRGPVPFQAGLSCLLKMILLIENGHVLARGVSASPPRPSPRHTCRCRPSS
jgi:hypothetical protein